MLELPILATYVICVAGMMKLIPRKRNSRPIWERENGKEEMENWHIGFLGKLKRTSTRSTKCRLISSVERMEFENFHYSYRWHFVQFADDEGEIFDKNEECLQKFKITEFQKLLLNSDSMLKNQLLSRSEIKEETGEWTIAADLQNKIISEGGEACVFSENFDGFETAVRVQIFDPFLFTDDFGLDSLSWKMHFEKG